MNKSLGILGLYEGLIFEKWYSVPMLYTGIWGLIPAYLGTWMYIPKGLRYSAIMESGLENRIRYGVTALIP